MVLLRPNVLMAAYGGPQPRSQLAANGIQMYGPGRMFWSKKGVILRNVPYTAANPTAGQIETRINFGEIARRHRGERGFRNGLPVVASYVRDEMRGYHASNRLSPESYPSKVKSSYHTLEELKSMLGGKRGRAYAFEEY